jgi:hypothetical protein
MLLDRGASIESMDRVRDNSLIVTDWIKRYTASAAASSLSSYSLPREYTVCHMFFTILNMHYCILFIIIRSFLSATYYVSTSVCMRLVVHVRACMFVFLYVWMCMHRVYVYVVCLFMCMCASVERECAAALRCGEWS